MSTRNIVPRLNKEGNVGTLLKKWLKGFFYDLHIEHEITDEANTVTVAQLKVASDNQHTHGNQFILDNTQQSFTTVLKTDYDNAVALKHGVDSPNASHYTKAQMDTSLATKADLADGKVPASQLPSFVDDVIESVNFAALPATGENGKIYITLDDNKTYRWSGSAYAIISDTLALGETSATAYRGDRGKTAYDHSQQTGNPHATSKSDIGLSNVPNLDTTNAVNNQHTHLNKSLLDTYTQTETNLADAVNKKHDVNTANNSHYTKAENNTLLTAKADLLNGRVVTAQLPSTIDLVTEYASIANFPATGETNRAYVALNTQKVYRWSGTIYVEITAGSNMPLLSGTNIFSGQNTFNNFPILPPAPSPYHSGGDIGGYQFNGSNNAVELQNDSNINFSTNDFSLLVFLKTANDALYNTIIEKGNADWSTSNTKNGWAIWRLTSNWIFKLNDGTLGTGNALVLPSSFPSLTTLIITVGSTINGYINGQLYSTTARTLLGSVSNTDALRMAKSLASATTYLSGKILLIKLFNRELSSSDVLSYNNNNRPDLYETPYSDRNAKQIILTSGNLLYGKRYKIDNYMAGDDFAMVATVESGTINTSNCIFICKGTTPTTWTNGSSLRQIGCTVEFLPSHAGRLGWIDGSENQLACQTIASPICLNTEARSMQYRDVKKAIANTTTTLTSIIPRGYIIRAIRGKGSAALTGVRIGTSSGGQEVVADCAVNTSAILLTLVATANAGYTETADQTLYVQHATAGQTLDIIFKLEKVAN